MSDLKICIIQSDIKWHDKAANYKNFAQKIAKIAKDVDLIVMPEMFNTGFTMQPQECLSYNDEIVQWLYSQIKDFDCAIVCSAATAINNSDIVNRMYFVSSDNDVYTYDKVHLFKHASEHIQYSPGNKRSIISYKGFDILLTVCFDLRFPVFNCNNDEYDLLINVASWPESRREHWNTLLKARSIENQAYVISCNRVGSDPNVSYAGDSSIIKFDGTMINTLKDKEDFVTGSINKQELLKYRNDFNFLSSQDEYTLKL